MAAATAGGKTEAAFLPICSRLVDADGASVLYLSPLKALINDQYERLLDLCKGPQIPVFRWHGDVAASHKRRFLKRPSGIVLITPESLEALYINHGSQLSQVFSNLRYLVIDELHAFIGSERGRQLQSLLHRTELCVHRRLPRIGLSATLGNMQLAAEYLRPGRADGVVLVTSDSSGQAIRLQVRGYVQPAPIDTADATEAEMTHTPDVDAIATHLFRTLRGDNHLVFANRKRDVEMYADILLRACEAAKLPNEFLPHHGNLSKALREAAEAALKDSTRPATAICTSTLELGIDVGHVKSIVQIGAPPSVAGMRQRLGRSGRRGEAAILRLYICETTLGPDASPQDRLRAELVQTIAMVGLLLQKWCEPPEPHALHLSTLVQQVLSLVAQHGAVRAHEAWRALCENGPFVAVSADMFSAFLRSLGAHDLVQQMHTGELVLGVAGERLVNHYEFYAAFSTPKEYELVAEGQSLGSLPIYHPLTEDMLVIFAGRRWRVVHVDDRRKVVGVVPAVGGRPPLFGGTGPGVHDRVREEMYRVYTTTDVPRYLDATARELLAEGRGAFADLKLAERTVVSHGDDTLLFCWKGDRIINTLMLLLRRGGFRVEKDGLAITIEQASHEEIRAHLHTLSEEPLVDSSELAATARTLMVEKHDVYLPPDLLCQNYASRHLDPQETYTWIARNCRSGTA